MTKYRIRLKNGRVIGPFVKDQLLELKVKGHIQGTEDAQLFPTGDWKALTHFDFYQELMKESQPSGLGSTPKEETFVIDLAKLRNQKNEKEVEALDIEEHLPVESLTETIQLQTSQPEPSINSKFEIELDHHLAQATIDLEEIAPEVDQEIRAEAIKLLLIQLPKKTWKESAKLKKRKSKNSVLKKNKKNKKKRKKRE
jgi:hypothetical protein